MRVRRAARADGRRRRAARRGEPVPARGRGGCDRPGRARVRVRAASGADHERAARRALGDPDAAARELLQACIVDVRRRRGEPAPLDEPLSWRSAARAVDPHAEILLAASARPAASAVIAALDPIAHLWAELEQLARAARARDPRARPALPLERARDRRARTRAAARATSSSSTRSSPSRDRLACGFVTRLVAPGAGLARTARPPRRRRRRRGGSRPGHRGGRGDVERAAGAATTAAPCAPSAEIGRSRRPPRRRYPVVAAAQRVTAARPSSPRDASPPCSSPAGARVPARRRRQRGPRGAGHRLRPPRCAASAGPACNRRRVAPAPPSGGGKAVPAAVPTPPHAADGCIAPAVLPSKTLAVTAPPAASLRRRPPAGS